MSIVHTLALELKISSCFCWFKPAVKSVMLSFSELTTEDIVGWLLVTQGSTGAIINGVGLSIHTSVLLLLCCTFFLLVHLKQIPQP